MIAGSRTFLNVPPSTNATLDDVIELGVNAAAKGIKIRDAVSTLDGPFCYIYEEWSGDSNGGRASEKAWSLPAASSKSLQCTDPGC